MTFALLDPVTSAGQLALPACEFIPNDVEIGESEERDRGARPEESSRECKRLLFPGVATLSPPVDKLNFPDSRVLGAKLRVWLIELLDSLAGIGEGPFFLDAVREEYFEGSRSTWLEAWVGRVNGPVRILSVH